MAIQDYGSVLAPVCHDVLLEEARICRYTSQSVEIHGWDPASSRACTSRLVLIGLQAPTVNAFDWQIKRNPSMQAHRPVSSRGSSKFVVYLDALSAFLHAGLVIAGSASRIPVTNII